MRRLMLSLLFLAIAPVCPATAQTANNNCLNLNIPADAKISACTRAISSHQLKGIDLARAYVNRARAYVEKNEADRAIADSNEAIQLDPKAMIAYGVRGDAYYDKGELDRAIADYTEAIRLSRHESAVIKAEPYRSRGRAYLAKKDLDSAIADYSEAIRLNAKHPLGYLTRAFAYIMKNEFDRAIADSTEAIRLRPDDPNSSALRAIAYENKRDYHNAINDWRVATALGVKDGPDRIAKIERLIAQQIAAVPAGRRVALVIGNSAYQHTERLNNPRNDAEDVSRALRRIEFEVITGLDLDKAGMEEATIRFARAAREADVAMFYYSGHALQFNGVNYLMPVDARLNDEADLRRMARVDEVMADVQQAKNLRILVLDSCRDNPLAEQLKRRIGTTRGAGIARGLARIDSPQGMILAFSTQAGSVASDGSGRNSPYTAAFLKHIESVEEIGMVFRRVSADVYAATKQKQLPELSLSLIGEFYLKGRPAAVPQAGQE